MENKPNKPVRYATYYRAWNKPFSLTTHGAEQHFGRRNKMFVERYCLKHQIKPVLEFTDHSTYDFTNHEELPGLNAVRKTAKAKKFDVLIILRFKDVGQNIRGLVNIVSELLKSDVSVYCIERPFTTYFNNGRLILLPLEPDDSDLKKYGNQI